MKKLAGADVVLKALGVLLLAAAALKGRELLTVPTANKDLWSWRPFLVFQVEFELALGIWLLSGIFKRLAWLAALACFGLFCCVTLYKALTGAASCGCFGTVHVNPWITLCLIDLPAIVALTVFGPGGLRPERLFQSLHSPRRRIPAVVRRFLHPLPSLPRFTLTAIIGLAVLSTTTPILTLNKPGAVTSTYEVLEPKTWIGKELPILEHIDIAGQLSTGTWLLLFHHHDCPDCQKAVRQYEQMAHGLAGNEDFLRIGLIEVPPYGQMPVSRSSAFLLGKMNQSKEWFMVTPVGVLIRHGQVVCPPWEKESPVVDAVIRSIVDG